MAVGTANDDNLRRPGQLRLASQLSGGIHGLRDGAALGLSAGESQELTS
jgi:hypothetical protein